MPPRPAPSEVAAALAESRSRDREAFDRLVDLLYADLRRLAHRQLGRMRPGQTLDTTSLVHEAYLKMAGSGDFLDRAHFLHASARAMRHILVNAARRKTALKRGGGLRPDTLDEELAGVHRELTRILAVDRGLERLRSLDERLREVVECRFFAGMTEKETAEALGVSDRTVRRDWLRARAWLRRELRDGGDGAGADGARADGAGAEGAGGA